MSTAPDWADPGFRSPLGVERGPELIQRDGTIIAPTVSPGSREADTATPVGRHAHPYPDVMSPAQIAARFTMLDHQYDLRRKQSPFADYQPRHEARVWGVRHAMSEAATESWGYSSRVTAMDAVRDCNDLEGPPCALVSRVLPDGEWEVAS